METFETTLTGSDGNITGLVKQLSKEAYQFTSIDGTLYLTIAKNEHGKWVRLSGSEPYFSGWVDELTEKISAQPKTVKHVVTQKTADPAKTAVKKTADASEKAPVTKKIITKAAEQKTKTAAAPSIKKTKPDTDKKTTVTASASKKAKVSSAASKSK